MSFTHDIGHALEEAGDAEYAQALASAERALITLKKQKDDNSLPVLNLAEREDDLASIEEAARHIGTFKTFVVIGMGGSSYGGKALCALTHNPFVQNARTVIHFLDNIDPLTSDKLLLSLDLKTTFFAVVSKSGDTAETLALALILVSEAEERLGKDAVKDHFLAITEPKESALSRLVQKYGMQVLAHDPGIGGRFSVLSAVGLLPAKVAGLDIRAVRKGAASVVAQTFGGKNSEPARGAALLFALLQKGCTMSVMMPYCDRLDVFNTWFRQLWAESLGKGGKGFTPLRSLGVCDQHSQLQLYLDGPRDKLITLLLLEQHCKGATLPAIEDPALSYLKGRTLGDLMDAEQRATAETLIRNRCPVRVFRLKELDEEALGALMMHFMLETMIMGEMLGINTFDQPAVEEGKKLAREYLAKQG